MGNVMCDTVMQVSMKSRRYVAHFVWLKSSLLAPMTRITKPTSVAILSSIRSVRNGRRCWMIMANMTSKPMLPIIMSATRLTNFVRGTGQGGLLQDDISEGTRKAAQATATVAPTISKPWAVRPLRCLMKPLSTPSLRNRKLIG